MPESEFPGQEQEAPSKSELKRRMTALQELGESLTRLSEKELAQVPISDPHLLAAIRETGRIRSNSARRRHLQYIGKLMRGIDPAPIKSALEALHDSHRRSADSFHELEALRDDILAAGPDGVGLAIRRWPEADRQQLHQLVLQYRREEDRGGPQTASRKLFRYLRELQARYG